MTMQFGLKLGSKDISYTNDIVSYYNDGYFQYMELFAVPGSFDDTIGYWRQFSIPMIIHAPHSSVGMNLSSFEAREGNKGMIREAFRFADTLKARYIIFHAGVNGDIGETINQLHPFVDSRCLIENQPIKGLNGENCAGATPKELSCAMNELQTGFCLDFGHAICAANTVRKEPIGFIGEFIALNPSMYHLTDGDMASECDSHLHYGDGTFPLSKLLGMLPDGAMVTNEAKHDSDIDLSSFKKDFLYAKAI